MKPFDSAPVVSHDLQMQFVHEDGRRFEVPANLSYTTSDPDTVTATIRNGADEQKWVFAREVLRDGMQEVAVGGDIVIRPSHPARGQVRFTKKTAGGSAVLEGSRHQIAAFVDEVFHAVPDHQDVDFDAELAKLLPSAPSITHDLQMQVVVDDGRRVSLPASLSYNESDPHAVTATFRTGEETVEWVFARDLLRDGMRDIAGYGDIVIRPGHPSRGAQVVFTLTSPSGSAVIEGPRHQIAAFVAEVYHLVPEDDEWRHLDIDQELDEIFRAA
jgi:hypothetical protein